MPKLPTIHLNGTSARELYNQWEDVANTAQAMLDALSLATPNGRDYYPQGPQALAEAIREHEARIAAVRAVRADAYAIAEIAAERM